MNVEHNNLSRESPNFHQDHEQPKSHSYADSLELMDQIPKMGLTPPETPKTLLPVLKHGISDVKKQKSESDSMVNTDQYNEENSFIKIIESYYLENSTPKRKKRRKRQCNKGKTQDTESHDHRKSQKRRTILIMDAFENIFTPCYAEDKASMESMGSLVQTQRESDSPCRMKKPNISISQKSVSVDTIVPNLEDEEEIQNYEDDTSETLSISQRSTSNEMRACR